MAWKAGKEQIGALNEIRQAEKGHRRHWAARPKMDTDTDLWFSANGVVKDLAPDRDNLELTARITAITPDEERDVILPRGGDLKRFRDSPTVLFGHDYRGMLDSGICSIVGKALHLKVSDTDILSRVQFAPTDFAKQLYELCLGDYIRMWSIGFIPHDESAVTDDDRKAHPDVDWDKVDRVIRTWTLLEHSLCPIGCNPDALTLGVKSGKLAGYDGRLLKSLGYDPKRAVATEAEDEPERADLGELTTTIIEADDPETSTITFATGEKTVVETKPGWEQTDDYYRYRIRDPGDFQDGTFKTKTLKKDPPRVMSTMAKLKGETTLTAQSVMFPKEDNWTLSGAKEWYKDHADTLKRSFGEQDSEDADETEVVVEAPKPTALNKDEYMTEEESARLDAASEREACLHGIRSGKEEAEMVVAAETGIIDYAFPISEEQILAEVMGEK